MLRYSEERKAAVLKKLLPPENRSVARILKRLAERKVVYERARLNPKRCLATFDVGRL